MDTPRDPVLMDLEMPELDGFDTTEQINVRNIVASSDGLRTFHPEIQAEITRRLGATRTRTYLDALLQQCEAMAAAAKGPRAKLRALAHDLASTAGMFGYEELSKRCREVQSGVEPAALERLDAALRRTMVLLRLQTRVPVAA